MYIRIIYYLCNIIIENIDMEYSDIHFAPDPSYRSPAIKTLYADEFLSNIIWFAPKLDCMTAKRYHIVSVRIVETKINAYGDKPMKGVCYKGVALEIERKEPGDKFTMELYRKYRDDKPLHYKQHGEVRYFHHNRAAVKKLGLNKIPLAFYLKMCANKKVEEALLNAAAKTEVFLWQDTPLEAAESKKNRARIAETLAAQRKEIVARKDAAYTERRKAMVKY